MPSAIVVCLFLRVLAYAEAIHSLLDERALPAPLLDTRVRPATAADQEELRRAIWRAGANHPDDGVKRRFLGRYPTEEGFDPWAFKELLGFNPDVPVFGIDRLAEKPPATLREILSLGSREPDDDRRNQDRFAHDRARQVRHDAWRRPLPADPLQLDMSTLTGEASQGYAHYGLPRLDFSDDPDVLKQEPRRWLYRTGARAYAPEFNQLHTDLAICAAMLGGEALGWSFLGHSHHYLQDVANQIHTLQAVYGFFYDAKIASYKEELFSLGGLLRSRRDFVAIGIKIIENHHSLIENLWRKRVLEAVAGVAGPPEVREALALIERGDVALEQALDGLALEVDAEWGKAITQEVVEASSREGGEVYEASRAFALASLSRASGVYDGTQDPDLFVRDDVEAATMTSFHRLQAISFGRAGSALRRHVRMYQAVLAQATSDETRRARFEATAQRLVATQLRELEAREERLARWLPSAPPAEKINWLVPAIVVGFFAVVVGVPGWMMARRRRRKRAAAA